MNRFSEVFSYFIILFDLAVYPLQDFGIINSI